MKGLFLLLCSLLLPLAGTITCLAADDATHTSEPHSASPAENLQSDLAMMRKFRDIRLKMKRKYVGLDYWIDRIMDQTVDVYLHPERVSAPTFLHMDSIPGMGKTSLIQDLMHELGIKRDYIAVKVQAGIANQFPSDALLTMIKSNQNKKSGYLAVVFVDESQNLGGAWPNLAQGDNMWHMLGNGRIEVPVTYNSTTLAQWFQAKRSADSTTTNLYPAAANTNPDV